MRAADRNDLIAGGLVAAFGTAVLLYIRGFPELPSGQPGPALFPGILGGLMVLFGATLMVQAARSTAGHGPAETGVPPSAAGEQAGGEGGAAGMRPRRAVANFLAVAGAIGAYLLVAEYLGFPTTLAAVLALLMLALGVRPIVAAGTAVATSAFVYVLFGMVLIVPLPEGPFGF